MFILVGPPAFTPARLARKLERLSSVSPGITAVSARFIHFVDVARPLDDRALPVLGGLLEYGPRLEQVDVAGREWCVVPRIGTISPWSSKATDIAHNCGLDDVRRIERGIQWSLAGDVPDTKALRVPSALTAVVGCKSCQPPRRPSTVQLPFFSESRR